MPNTNILSLNYSDNQPEIISKINNNFDEVVEFHGGSQGLTGPTGAQGAIGENGPRGEVGVTGSRGTRWFVNNPAPLGGSGEVIIEGDYWIDSISGGIYIFTQSGWTDTTYNLNPSGAVFSSLLSTFSPSIGGTGQAIVENQLFPNNYTFNVSDVTPESQIISESLSKFLLSTNPLIDPYPLLEFSRSNLENGQISDYSLHPIFRWLNFTSGDSSLVLESPGGSFNIGASGGFESNFGVSNINSSSSFTIDSSSSSGANSGIFSTGGFQFVAPSGDLYFSSTHFGITGGSGYFSKSVGMTAYIESQIPMVYVYSAGSTGFKSQRSGDTYNTLSNSVYHLKLENNIDTQLYLNTKGKLKINKVTDGITYPNNSIGATSTSNLRWYFLSVPGSPSPYTPLTSGNTIVISPEGTTTSQDVGICFGTDSYGWGSTGTIRPYLQNGESIDVNLFVANNSIGGYWNNASGVTASNSYGVRYIGYGTTGSISTQATFPFRAQAIDFTIAKGVTGSKLTVYYKAYNWGTGGYGCSGGYFTF
jgi:hypothetical protein